MAAVDVGKVRIGLAVSDELGMLAHLRPHLDGRNTKAALRALADLARDEGISRFLVGLPLDLRGDAGAAARRAERFAEALAEAADRDVELVDERLSTVEATRRLREGGASTREMRSRVDGAAAAVILQAWLDAASERGR